VLSFLVDSLVGDEGLLKRGLVPGPHEVEDGVGALVVVVGL